MTFLLLEKYHFILPYKNFSLLNISQKHKVGYSLSWLTINMSLLLWKPHSIFKIHSFTKQLQFSFAGSHF